MTKSYYNVDGITIESREDISFIVLNQDADVILLPVGNIPGFIAKLKEAYDELMNDEERQRIHQRRLANISDRRESAKGQKSVEERVKEYDLEVSASAMEEALKVKRFKGDKENIVWPSAEDCYLQIRLLQQMAIRGELEELDAEYERDKKIFNEFRESVIHQTLTPMVQDTYRAMLNHLSDLEDLSGLFRNYYLAMSWNKSGIEESYEQSNGLIRAREWARGNGLPMNLEIVNF